MLCGFYRQTVHDLSLRFFKQVIAKVVLLAEIYYMHSLILDYPLSPILLQHILDMIEDLPFLQYTLMHLCYRLIYPTLFWVTS